MTMATSVYSRPDIRPRQARSARLRARAPSSRSPPPSSPSSPSSSPSRSSSPSPPSSSAKASAASRTATAPTASAPSASSSPSPTASNPSPRKTSSPAAPTTPSISSRRSLLVVAAFLAYAVLPIGRNMVIANLNAGVLFFFAVGTLVELAVFMAGWSSHSKYSLLGAMRAIAQMISYEVPLVLASVVVIMAAGSLSTVTIVEAADRLHRHLPPLVRLHPLGIRRLHPLHDRRHRRIQPLALRPSRRRIRNHRRLLHRILRLQIRPLLPRRIPRHVRHQRHGHHPLPRRLVRPVLLPHLDPVLRSGSSSSSSP